MSLVFMARVAALEVEVIKMRNKYEGERTTKFTCHFSDGATQEINVDVYTDYNTDVLTPLSLAKIAETKYKYEFALLKRGRDSACEAVILLNREIDGLEDQIRTMQVGQRVSDVAYNLLHGEYRKAYGIAEILLQFADPISIEAYKCFDGRRDPRDEFKELMELPPPDTKPAAQLPANLTGSSDLPDAPNTGTGSPDPWNTNPESGSGPDNTPTT